VRITKAAAAAAAACNLHFIRMRSGIQTTASSRREVCVCVCQNVMQGRRVRGGAGHHLAVVIERGGGVRTKLQSFGGRVEVGGGTLLHEKQINEEGRVWAGAAQHLDIGMQLWTHQSRMCCSSSDQCCAATVQGRFPNNFPVHVIRAAELGPLCVSLYYDPTIFRTFSILLGPSSTDDSTIFQLLITVTILVFPRQP